MRSTALALLFAIGAGPAAAQTLQAEVIRLQDWNTDALYGESMSAEQFIDDRDVLGTGGEEAGDVEDIIVGADGKLLAVVVEVGGVLDIGDTHVAVPWAEVTVEDDHVTVPVLADNIGEYGFFDHDYFTREDVTAGTVSDLENADTGPRVFRLSELIGDYARLTGGDATEAYGYVNDVLIDNGEITAVVVEPDEDFGRGTYAYPYDGTAYTPGMPYYDLPYGRAEIEEADAAELDYERLNEG